MDVARIARNKIELRMERGDVRTVVDMATATTRAQFEANEQERLVQLPAAPV
jgi:hypothetical protein